MGIRSSWNSDRVASVFVQKSHASSYRSHKRRSSAKTMKVSDIYIKEYGEMAYNAWKRREEEIDSMMRKGYSVSQIAKLREENLRQMKEADAWQVVKMPVFGMLSRTAA